MEPLLVRLQRALAGRYSVEHELGRGGMAVVYLGQDLRLERRVAIKVFEKEGGLISAGERFLREIQVAAKLQHPNILPVFESGEGEGLVYYVMPYVAGGSVRERLEREGPLPVADAVRIAREVAEALDHAHRAGIVHRDIKPDNIMLADGVAVVADFGIARAIEEAGGKVTDTGLAIGTPAYMSPEQATAESKLDGRSDQYALGCVLYELLAGTPPFTGPTSQAVMARHAADAVSPLTTLRAVPVALERAIVKALAKMPADRWPTAKAFGEALEKAAAPDSGAPARRSRWIVRGGIGAGALTVAVAGWLLLSPARGSSAAAATLKRVAVLPFKFIGDTSQAYIADGLAEAIHSGLVRAQGLLMTEPGRVSAYRDSLVDVREIGGRLRLDAVVTATVQRTGTTLRVTPHLVDVSDGRDLWSEHYDGEVVDVFAFQDSITVKVVQALLPRLTSARRAAVVRGVRTRDTMAYRLYLEARQAIFQFTRASVERARLLLEQAIARDSLFADAWAALVPTIDGQARWSRDPPEQFNASIRRAANRAVELDSSSGYALVWRGWTRALQDWDWDLARRDMRRALSLSPGSPDVLNDYAYMEFMSQPESLLAYARRTFDSSAVEWGNLGYAYAGVGKSDSALIAFEHAVAMDSNAAYSYLWLAMEYLNADRRVEANRALGRFLELSGDDAQGIGWAAVYYRRARDTAGARAMLARLERVSRERTWGVNSATSMVRLALGDRAGALDALEAAARVREYLLPATVAYALAPLRNEPRWKAVRQMVYGNRAPDDLFP